MKAPFTWPNSSLSSRVSGIAAQLMATNGPSLRPLFAWSALATSSLPVPLSPVMSTVVSVSATRVTSSHILSIAGLVPRISSKRWRAVDRLAEALHLFAERPVPQGALDRERELVHVERLRDEVVRARADRGDGRLHVRERGDHDDRHVFAATDELLAELDAVHAGHVHVGDREAEVFALEDGDERSWGSVNHFTSNSRRRSSLSSTSQMLRSSSMMRMRRSMQSGTAALGRSAVAGGGTVCPAHAIRHPNARRRLGALDQAASRHAKSGAVSAVAAGAVLAAACRGRAAPSLARPGATSAGLPGIGALHRMTMATPFVIALRGALALLAAALGAARGSGGRQADRPRHRAESGALRGPRRRRRRPHLDRVPRPQGPARVDRDGRGVPAKDRLGGGRRRAPRGRSHRPLDRSHEPGHRRLS